MLMYFGRMSSRGLDVAIVKIVFLTVSLVLATLAVKMAYQGFGAAQTNVTMGVASMSPQDAISNLTKSIAENV